MKNLYILLCVVIMSCSNNNLVVKKTVNFKNPLNGNFRFFGNVNDSVVYFADLVTKKKIYFHNANGKLIDSINFKPRFKTNATIWSLNFVSIDTFMTTYKKNLFFYNSNSKIIKHINIDTLLKNSDNIYHFEPSKKLQLNKHNFLIGLDWRKSKTKTYDIKQHSKNAFDNPNIIKISKLFSNKPEVEFIEENYYAYLFKDIKSLGFLESFKLYKFKKNHLLASVYGEHIITIDSTLNYNKFKFNSDYTQHGKKIGSIHAKDWSGSSISNIFFIDNTYKIQLRHKVDKDKAIRGRRAFSILTYDTNFNKIDEKVQFSLDYIYYQSFSLNNTIYVKKDIENENIYDVF